MGENWTTQFSIIYQPYWFQDIYFYNDLCGWIVGQKNATNTFLILYTEDDGQSWEEQTIEGIPEPSIVNCVYFVNDTTGWIGVGETQTTDPYGAIYFTNDGGENWQLQQEFYQAILDIQMLNRDTGWAVGGDYIYYTTNGDTIIIAGVDENIPEKGLIKITPNPTNGVFSIKNNSQLSTINYQLTDITGKEIMSRGHVPLQIDISNQPKGIYFITIKFHINNQIYSLTKKIIKL